MSAAGTSPVWDLADGDVIWVPSSGHDLVRRRVVAVVPGPDNRVMIRFAEDAGSEIIGSWVVNRNFRVQIASGWRDDPRHLSTPARVALRGAPFGAVVAALEILGALLHVPSGGGIAFLVVVLWLAGCFAMVTTPEGDR